MEVYSVNNGVALVLLANGLAVKDLFAEFDSVPDECVKEVFDKDFKLKDKVPARMTRAVASRDRPTCRKPRIVFEKEQDIKDIFWGKVDTSEYHSSERYKTAITSLPSWGGDFA